jgi:hypothetical protein
MTVSSDDDQRALHTGRPGDSYARIEESMLGDALEERFFGGVLLGAVTKLGQLAGGVAARTAEPCAPDCGWGWAGRSSSWHELTELFGRRVDLVSLRSCTRC